MGLQPLDPLYEDVSMLTSIALFASQLVKKNSKLIVIAAISV